VLHERDGAACVINIASSYSPVGAAAKGWQNFHKGKSGVWSHPTVARLDDIVDPKRKKQNKKSLVYAPAKGIRAPKDGRLADSNKQEMENF